MDFILALIIIFVPVGFIVKISDINDKMDNNEELTSIENLIYNIAIGLVRLTVFILSILLNFIFPIGLMFLFLVFMIIQIVVQVSNDLIPFAIIIAAVVAIFMYIFMAHVINLGTRKKVKKDDNINKENNNE